MIKGQLGAEGQSKISPVYEFGSFRFNPARGLLYHGADVIPLPERLTQLLVLLIHANGNVIDKETIAVARLAGERRYGRKPVAAYVYAAAAARRAGSRSCLRRDRARREDIASSRRSASWRPARPRRLRRRAKRSAIGSCAAVPKHCTTTAADAICSRGVRRAR